MLTVLVVDDTPIIRETVARLLRREGYQAVCAANGKEALATMRTTVPDLMLLDIMMPEMDGIECLQELRRNPVWQDIPVIIMTALSDDEHQREAEQLGAREFLVKARFSISQMLERVATLIADRHIAN